MKLHFSYQSCLRNLGALGLLVASSSLSLRADSFLPNVSNLNFLNYTGAAPKNSFSSVDPVGWTGGSGLIYIDAPGTATSGNGGIPVYGPFPNSSPVSGNFVQADGNPTYESGFNQTITGLTPGRSYTLSFYQAGGQQVDFGSGIPTTEQWIVSLGTAGLTVNTSGGPVDPIYGPTGSYYSTDPNASITKSQLMTTPSGGVTPWEYVSVTLTADSTTDLLSFLAWGDNGSTINLPPMVFLSGVNSPDVLTSPEPGTLSGIAIGLSGLGLTLGIRRRRKASGRNS
jgi:hypothetical protein